MKIRNFDYLIDSNDFDIIHVEKITPDLSISQSAEVILNYNNRITKIKFELARGNELHQNDFLYISETDTLFYRGMIEWCVFDLDKNQIKRHEDALELPFIERINDVIVVYDELYAESTDLNGNKIDYAIIDLPYESKEFNDRIEFDTCSFGKQTLKLEGTNYRLNTYKFSGGMNVDGSGLLAEIYIASNQVVKKGDKLALFSSGDYEMELKAETDGVIWEIMVSEGQILFQNDVLFKIKTTHNTV